ncbi:hypothetical protein LEP48_17790 [Isoptericola sp. NEAU-Y5]|uniref:Uncharacterized protein n=1 Tax=Isoptericola luteus TaxID=2879484 RepID=A0ABS7ZJI0_9MICO|nr:hypothetical protein [Isoptericola sp. NEAU-Y5]MCA5895184.1 hypothetical protein [Isoptericola sp. NEAU-Y5]
MIRNRAVVLTTAAALVGVLSAGALASGAGTTSALWRSHVSLALPAIVDGSEVKAPTITPEEYPDKVALETNDSPKSIAGIQVSGIAEQGAYRLTMALPDTWEFLSFHKPEYRFVILQEGKEVGHSADNPGRPFDIVLTTPGANVGGQFGDLRAEVNSAQDVTILLQVWRSGGGNEASSATGLSVDLSVFDGQSFVKVADEIIPVPEIVHRLKNVSSPARDLRGPVDHGVITGGSQERVAQPVPGESETAQKEALAPEPGEPEAVETEESVAAAEPEELAVAPETTEALPELEEPATDAPSADPVEPDVIQADELEPGEAQAVDESAEDAQPAGDAGDAADAASTESVEPDGAESAREPDDVRHEDDEDDEADEADDETSDDESDDDTQDGDEEADR